MIIMIHLPSCSIAFLTCSLHTALQPSHAASILAYCSTWAGGNHLTGWQENTPEYLHLCVIGWSCLRPAPAAPHHLMIGVSSQQPGAVLCVDTALYQHQTRRAAVSTFSRGSLAPNTGEPCTLQHTAPQSHCPRVTTCSCRQRPHGISSGSPAGVLPGARRRWGPALGTSLDTTLPPAGCKLTPTFLHFVLNSGQ